MSRASEESSRTLCRSLDNDSLSSPTHARSAAHTAIDTELQLPVGYCSQRSPAAVLSGREPGAAYPARCLLHLDP